MSDDQNNKPRTVIHNGGTLTPYTSETQPNKGGEDHNEAKAHRHMRSRARKYTDLALEALVEVASQSKNLAAKVDAAQELLTRGYGRPHVQQDGKEKTPATKINVSFGEGSQATIGIDGRERPWLAEHQFKAGIDPRRPHSHPNLTLQPINGELLDEVTDGDN